MALIATPGDVLAYRNAWDPYVMGTLRGVNTCADSFDEVAKNPPSGFTATQLQAMAESYRKVTQAYLAQWNQFAGLQPQDFLFQAKLILTTFQKLVTDIGQFRTGDNFKQFCGAVSLPAAPSLDVQREIISRLEGLKIVAKGVLNLFVESEKEGLKMVSDTTRTVVSEAGKAVGGAVANALPWWAWAGIALVGGTTAILAFKASPIGAVGTMLFAHRKR